MKRKDWYKRNPEKALFGMRDLDPAQRGVYNTLLDLMYLPGHRLKDIDSKNARQCNCDIRIYKRIKQHLISLGKIYVQNGEIKNNRASWQLSYAHSYRGSYGMNFQAIPNENNEAKINSPRSPELQNPRENPSVVGKETTTKDFLKMIQEKGLEFYLLEKTLQAAKDSAGRKDIYRIIQKYQGWIISPECKKPPKNQQELHRHFLAFLKADSQPYPRNRQ